MTIKPSPVDTPLQIDPALIDPNPYQPRLDMDPVALNRLAEDIKANGLLQPPAFRRAPGNRYQIIFGHRRVAAWQQAHPGLPVPGLLRDMTDQQMFAAAIVENDDREPLNAIERANALQSYIDTFHVKQADAAQLFGLKDQASVSNLLRLRKLPASVQAHVASGDLPERYAREMIPLLPLVGEKALINLAEKISTAQTPGDAHAYLETGITDLLTRHAPRLANYLRPFPYDWDPKVSADMGGTLMPLPACTGCAFILKRKHDEYCTRPACFSAKTDFHALDQARTVAAQLGLPRTAIADQGQPIVGTPKNAFESSKADLLRTALEHKHAGVMLLPTAGDQGNGNYWRDKITGNPLVDVTLVFGHTLESIATDLGQKNPAIRNPDAERMREAEKDARLKTEFDRLKEAAGLTVRKIVPLFRSTLTTVPAIAVEVIKAQPDTLSDWMEDKTARELDKVIRQRTATQPQMVDAIIGNILWNIADDVIPSWYKNFKSSDFQQVRDALADLARRCKIKLPSGWDASLTAQAGAVALKPKTAPTRKRKS